MREHYEGIISDEAIQVKRKRSWNLDWKKYPGQLFLCGDILNFTTFWVRLDRVRTALLIFALIHEQLILSNNSQTIILVQKTIKQIQFEHDREQFFLYKKCCPKGQA